MPDTDNLDPEAEEKIGPDEAPSTRSSGAGAGTASRATRSSGKEKTGLVRAEEKAYKAAGKIASKLGPEGRVAGKALEFLAKHKNLRRIAQAQSLLPFLLPILLVVFVIIIIVVIGGPSAADPNDPNAPKLIISKTGPTEAQIDVNPILDYQINVSYPGRAQDITVADRIPDGTEFVSSDQKVTCDNGECNNASRIVNWSLKDFVASESGALNNVSTALTLKLKALINNSFLVNQAEGAVIGAGTAPPGGPTTEGYVPPNDNDCGKYSSLISKNRFLPKNYGDPECNFNKEKVDRLLREKDGENAEWWFLVIQCESGYNPNNWLDPDTIVEGYRSPDAGGAWGLFQNGSSAVFPDRLYGSTRQESVRLEEAIELPGRPPPAVGRSQDPYDRGDVNWFLQIENAIKLLPERGKGYWACA